jgi:pimeloyl-ACP methyl ester carboxylesterase
LSGEPTASVLLLHGQPGSARDWDRVRAALDGRVRTVAIDRPGWNGRGSGRDLAGNVQAAVAALDWADVSRAIVVGQSFGGAVASWLAVEHPERVGALVLLAPAANVASLQWIDWCLAAPVVGPALSAAAVGAPALALSGAHTRRFIAARFELDEDYLRAVARVYLRPAAWRTFLLEQRALIDQLPVLESRLGRIAAPTTIVIGSADRVVPASSAKVLAGQIPGAALVPLRGAGHLVSLRHPELVAQITLAAAAAASAAGAAPGAVGGAGVSPGPGSAQEPRA